MVDEGSLRPQPDVSAGLLLAQGAEGDVLELLPDHIGVHDAVQLLDRHGDRLPGACGEV